MVYRRKYRIFHEEELVNVCGPLSVAKRVMAKVTTCGGIEHGGGNNKCLEKHGGSIFQSDHLGDREGD